MICDGCPMQEIRGGNPWCGLVRTPALVMTFCPDLSIPAARVPVGTTDLSEIIKSLAKPVQEEQRWTSSQRKCSQKPRPRPLTRR